MRSGSFKNNVINKLSNYKSSMYNIYKGVNRIWHQITHKG